MAYTTDTIRNIAVCGHGSTGKTTLVEQILFNAGVISRAERVESGRTVSDFTDEEIEKKMSLHSSLTNVEWRDTKINIFDTPGVSDFIGEVVASFRATESAVMLIGARSGIQIETIKLWNRLNKRDMPRMVFINKMEKNRADFYKILKELADFGVSAIPITIPMGQAENYQGVINLLTLKAYKKDAGGKEESAIPIPAEYKEIAEEYHLKMIEMAAEGDDELMERYFQEENLSLDEAIKGLREGLFENRFVPVFCGSAIDNSGITPLMDFIAYDSPAPGRVEEPCISGEKAQVISTQGKPSGIVFKTRIDKFAGKVSYVKVITGILRLGDEVYNPREDKKEKINKLFACEGKALKEVSEVHAGDIAVLSKQHSLATNDTICQADDPIHYRSLALPHPIYSLAIRVDTQKEEDKMASALLAIAEEDLTFTLRYNGETRQTVASGMGEYHLNIIFERLLKNHKINVKHQIPQVAYRETITQGAEAEYTHKKQSGGHGQYGRVAIRIQPLEQGEVFSFSNDIKGGVISKGYMPGIEKGLREGMEEGTLAGYPLTDIGVSVFDGKEHSVDSSEMAFRIAAKNALKEAVKKASPTLLEPIMILTVYVNSQYLGDTLSDLSAKRGRVMDQKALGGDIQSVKALVPQGELMRYSIELKSRTSGTGAFELEFSHYEPVGGRIAQDIIDARQEKS